MGNRLLKAKFAKYTQIQITENGLGDDLTKLDYETLVEDILQYEGIEYLLLYRKDTPFMYHQIGNLAIYTRMFWFPFGSTGEQVLEFLKRSLLWMYEVVFFSVDIDEKYRTEISELYPRMLFFDRNDIGALCHGTIHFKTTLLEFLEQFDIDPFYLPSLVFLDEY